MKALSQDKGGEKMHKKGQDSSKTPLPTYYQNVFTMGKPESLTKVTDFPFYNSQTWTSGENQCNVACANRSMACSLAGLSKMLGLCLVVIHAQTCAHTANQKPLPFSGF